MGTPELIQQVRTVNSVQLANARQAVERYERIATKLADDQINERPLRLFVTLDDFSREAPEEFWITAFSLVDAWGQIKQRYRKQIDRGDVDIAYAPFEDDDSIMLPLDPDDVDAAYDKVK